VDDDGVRLVHRLAGVAVHQERELLLATQLRDLRPEALATVRRRVNQRVEIKFGQRLAHQTAVWASLEFIELEMPGRLLRRPAGIGTTPQAQGRGQGRIQDVERVAHAGIKSCGIRGCARPG
jgi:hypothetical protein